MTEDYQEQVRREISDLKLRLGHDLQSVYLGGAMREIHPAILQIALEQFAKVAVERKRDRRINIKRAIDILKGDSNDQR